MAAPGISKTPIESPMFQMYEPEWKQKMGAEGGHILGFLIVFIYEAIKLVFEWLKDATKNFSWRMESLGTR